MHIQLTAIKRLFIGGQLTTRYPGDFVEVSRATAMNWVQEGSARLTGPDAGDPKLVAEVLAGDCGVLMRGTEEDAAKLNLGLCRQHLEVVCGPLELPFERTLIVTPAAKPDPWQILLGFQRTETGWELAARLRSVEALLSDFGSEADKQGTQELIGDLRLPVYLTQALWVRRVPETELLVKQFSEYLTAKVSEEHSFIRALYTSKVRIYTFPSNWGASGR